jgi:hypothetical protein
MQIGLPLTQHAAARTHHDSAITPRRKNAERRLGCN